MANHSTKFSLDGYVDLLEALMARGYETVPFAHADPAARHLVVRHDVDMSLELAVALAEVESKMGVISSFFVLVRTEMYNPASLRGRAALQRLRALGREVGLHFDAAGLAETPEVFDAEAAKDCAFLESLLGDAIGMVSFHRPARSVQGYAPPIAGRLHAYMPRFFHEMGYCSDSAGSFRFGHPLDHAAIAAGRALQLVTHPIWWVASSHESVLGKLDRFRACRDETIGAELAANCTPYRDRTR
jgi:hypothetical protein